MPVPSHNHRLGRPVLLATTADPDSPNNFVRPSPAKRALVQLIPFPGKCESAIGLCLAIYCTSIQGVHHASFRPIRESAHPASGASTSRSTAPAARSFYACTAVARRSTPNQNKAACTGSAGPARMTKRRRQSDGRRVCSKARPLRDRPLKISSGCSNSKPA